MSRVARRSALVGRRRKAGTVTKLGGNENASVANTGKATAGRRETWPQTIAVSGTIKELKFKLREAVGTITSVRLGIIADDGTGTPVLTNVLAEGATTVGVTAAGVVTVTGLSLHVNAGDKVHFAAMAIGGNLTYYGETGGFTTHESTNTGTEIKGVTGWEAFTNEVGPVYFAALGEAEEAAVGAPTLSVNGTDHQTVEWNAVGADAEGYTVGLSLEPASAPARKVTTVTVAKTANPQHFKPEVGTEYGNGVKPVAGGSVYVAVQVKPSGPFSTEVVSTMPAAEEGGGGGGGSPGFLKGVEIEGWNKSEETGDAAEAKLNATRINKPSRTELVEWESKGITPVYLFAYNTPSGQISTGVKGINRAAWVADAIAKIKEVKPKYFEPLNEPGGDWFWGSGANSEANGRAYVELLKLLKEELIAKVPAAERPLILASLDGGHNGEKGWVENMKKGAVAAGLNLTDWFDYGTCHPYGGTGERSKSKEGHRDNVEAIRSYISAARPFFITEIGFPTIKQTGDSLQWTEAEAAANFASFLAWCKGLSWMKGAIIYGYRDGTGEPAGYGQWKLDDTAKLAVPKIAAA